MPSADRDTTSLVFVADKGAVLINCGGSPVAKLRRAGIDPLVLTPIIVTHLHAAWCARGDYGAERARRRAELPAAPTP